MSVKVRINLELTGDEFNELSNRAYWDDVSLDTYIKRRALSPEPPVLNFVQEDRSGHSENTSENNA